MTDLNLLINGKQIVVNPELEPAPPGLLFKAAYALDGNARGGPEESHQVSLGEDDIIEFTFEDQTTWLCGNDSLEALFPEAAYVKSRSGAAAFVLPGYLQPTTAERGWISNIAIKLVHIFTKTAIDHKVADIAKSIEDKQLEGKTGLYRLDPTFRLQPFTGEISDKPYLLFLHGTASSTEGSFAGMLHSPLWTYLVQQYEGRILAFNHRSLTESPLTNIRQLLSQLPATAELHLITHSRGGLLGEILCRYSSQSGSVTGFTEDEKALLNKVHRTPDTNDIREIENLMAGRKLIISKFIRVACPAAGTTLASKRLDNIFNVLSNLIGLSVAGIAKPVYDQFRTLISAVINTKNDPNVLPGIEAMNPESPFIKVLNNPGLPVDVTVPLVVIAGNCQVKLNLKALVVIATKLFFSRDNDLIVNTGSMYQGSRRSQPLTYYFDHNTDVNHFSYFRNERTQRLLLAALRHEGEGLIPGFSTMTHAEAEASRNAVLNLEGGKLMRNDVSGKRPIAVILPGIMGSNLDVGGKSVWINYGRFLFGGLGKLEAVPGNVVASSVIATSYRKLADYLSDTYDVITFPFDWRLDPKEYTKLFNARITELLAYKQPIKIVGHSMGGVLVRDFMVNYTNTWNKLNDSAGFRLLFLGSPLGGSHRIVNVLFGEDAIISKLAKIDLTHSKKELIDIFAKMPGILSLLPLSEDKPNDFADTAIWDAMLDAFGWEKCDANRKKLFQEFGAYRKSIKESTGVNFKNAVYIAGKADATPCGYRIDPKKGGKELVFLSTPEGDQSVTWESGIPKDLIARDLVYYVQVSHGMLANEPKIFAGIADILASGKTSLLSKNRITVRGAEKIFRAPEVDDFDISPEGVRNTLLGLDTTSVDTAQTIQSSLRVSISQGDLQYAGSPVIAGHFSGDGILMAEKAIDRLLSNTLTRKHALGLYPGPVGSSEIVLAPADDTDNTLFKGALIVGLGDAGKLTAYQLTLTVEQGVASYLLLAARGTASAPAAGNPVLSLSSLIIGCGYGGLTIENSMRAILQGIQNANKKIGNLLGANAPAVGFLEFIEKYEDTALAAYYALDRLIAENNGTLNIVLDFKNIKTLFGLEKRMPADQIEAWWNRISVKIVADYNAPDKVKRMQFSASTGGARENVREVFSSMELLSGMIREISTNNTWSSETAKVIFELLIPNDFKEQFKKRLSINWILDTETAGYPWELLHDGRSDTVPLSVNAGMIRQLATSDYRVLINAVSSKTAVVIAEPNLQGMLPALPAAGKEGALVNGLLEEQGFSVAYTPNPSTIQVLKSLFARDYKIIHLAGHGIFNPLNPEASGMAIGPGVFLSTREIAQMSAVPELVFINCCYLGQVSQADEHYYQNRYKLAANIGTQLINNGVKVVVVAGWEVNDDAALAFTECFYKNLFSGYNFGDAVRLARERIYNQFPGSNTWGAYQCYGDPFYKISPDERPSAKPSFDFKTARQAEIVLFNLLNELEMPGTPADAYLNRLQYITEAVNVADLRNAKITELEAYIYAELAEYESAVRKFNELFHTEKAAFSFRAAERYCHIRGKLYVEQYFADRSRQTSLNRQMQLVIKEIESMQKLGETAERNNVLASAYKRKAILYKGEKKEATLKEAALKAAAFHYRESWKTSPGFYAYTSWIQLEGLLVSTGAHQWGTEVTFGKEEYLLPSLEAVDMELAQLLDTANTAPHVLDYWDWVAKANVMLCGLIIHPEKAGDALYCRQITSIFQKVWARAGSPYKRKSEEEQFAFLMEMLAGNADYELLRKSIENIRSSMKY